MPRTAAPATASYNRNASNPSVPLTPTTPFLPILRGSSSPTAQWQGMCLEGQRPYSHPPPQSFQALVLAAEARTAPSMPEPLRADHGPDPGGRIFTCPLEPHRRLFWSKPSVKYLDWNGGGERRFPLHNSHCCRSNSVFSFSPGQSGSHGQPCSLASYLSCDLCCSSSSRYSCGRRQASWCGWRQERHGRSDGLANAEVLAPQVKEVHGGDGILRGLCFLVLCSQKRQ